jgi:hypothetical protein
MFKIPNEIIKPDEFNFILPYGLGDTMYVCALKSAIEKKYNASIHFIIKPMHEIIMYMYDIVSYSIYQFNGAEVYSIAKNNYCPQKGRLYVAHPAFGANAGLTKNSITITQMFLRFFQLDENIVPLEPLRYPKIKESIAAEFPNLNNTALLLPEARDAPPLKHSFWKNLAGELREKGFNVLQSYSNKHFQIEGVSALPDDLPSVIAAAVTCPVVYSLRNGLCDLIAAKVRHLTIFYPTQDYFRLFYIEGKTIETVLVDMEEKKSLLYTKVNILKKKIKDLLWAILPIRQIRRLIRKFKYIYDRLLLRK